jgi:hypothetical protein
MNNLLIDFRTMQYNSVSEYFARLHAKSLFFLFASVLPMMLLIYLLMIGKLTFVMPTGEGRLVGYVLAAATGVDAVISFVLMKLLLRHAKQIPSLGERMDKYATVFYVRFALLLGGALMLMVAFVLSGMPWLVPMYGAYLLIFILSWPTRSRLSSELGLRESERAVIFEK